MFLYNTPENEEFLVVYRFPNFSSSEIVALVPLNMVVTEKKKKNESKDTKRTPQPTVNI